MNNKVLNNRAWLLVLPMLVLVAFSAIIPLMTVVNYSVQDVLGPNARFFTGTEWFHSILNDSALRDAFVRQILFSLTILAIQVPLGIGLQPEARLIHSAMLADTGHYILQRAALCGVIENIIHRHNRHPASLESKVGKAGNPLAVLALKPIAGTEIKTVPPLGAQPFQPQPVSLIGAGRRHGSL